jgi:hypothetical protein
MLHRIMPEGCGPVGPQHGPAGPQPGVDKSQTAGLQLEHFAFSATGLKDFLERLKREGVRYDARRVPRSDGVQINVWDPDGNHIHIDFAGAETAGVDFKDVDATAMVR